MGIYTLPVRITYPGAGGPGFNIWHARTTGATVDGDNQDLHALLILINNFYSDLRPIFTPQTVISWEGVATNAEDPSEQRTGAAPWTVTGQAPQGVMLPTAAQICVGWRTSSAERSGVGRTFLGPINSGSLDSASDGTPSAGTINLVRDVATLLVTNSTGSTNGALGVFSRQENLLRDFTGVRVRKTYAVLTSRRD